jgi:hypothetical protein
MALVLCATMAFANEPVAKSPYSIDDLEQMKQDTVTGNPDPQPQVGGEDIATAVNIPVLPYTDGGNTCGFINDYDEWCPYSGSTSPDVVYKYTPAGDIELDVILCNSFYDTKTYVYENVWPNLVACNDDDCGDYDLLVQECVPCIVECPAGAQLENEPDCYDYYVDNTNGGCNSTPNVFGSIACTADGLVDFCGKYGGFISGAGWNYRDTDWFEMDPDAQVNGFDFTVTGELGTLMGYINANFGCGAPFFEASLVLTPCVPGTIPIPAGNWWLWIGPSGYGPEAGPCGSDYLVELDGLTCPPVSVEDASWAEIKNNYK